GKKARARKIRPERDDFTIAGRVTKCSRGLRLPGDEGPPGGSGGVAGRAPTRVAPPGAGVPMPASDLGCLIDRVAVARGPSRRAPGCRRHRLIWRYAHMSRIWQPVSSKTSRPRRRPRFAPDLHGTLERRCLLTTSLSP